MDGVKQLLSEDGLSLLAQMPDYDPATADQLSAQLRRRGHPPDLVSAALSQQKLRLRATAKFGEDAKTMLFTQAGAQQATRAVVADLHARRYVNAGCELVADITCGIGADSLAFQRAGLEVIACDIDDVTAACARYNLSPTGGSLAAAPDTGSPLTRVLNTDGLRLDFSAVDGVFADPGRRHAARRTFNPSDYSPPLDQVLKIRDQVPALGVKVAPGIAYTDLPEDAHAQWVSVEGDVVEAGLWFGDLTASPGRSALVIKGGQITAVDATKDPRAPVVPMNPTQLGRYLYAPDGAVIRAGALDALAARVQAAPVSERIAYLTGSLLVRTPLATAFEVVEAVPLKKLRGYLRARKVGSLEILKRGVDIVPDQFRKRLALKGEGSATVVLTRLRGEHRAVVVKRV